MPKAEVFKKSALQTIETELEQQYTQQGRYDADVTVDTIARPNNRVELKLNFNEGTAAKVLISILLVILFLKTVKLNKLSQLRKVVGLRL